VAEWVDLLAFPQPVPGPFDWSLALGAYTNPRSRRRAVSPLGALLDAWRHQGDYRAGETLAHLLHRWLSQPDLADRFDLVTARPASLYSGPARDAASLLGWPELSWPPAIDPAVWRRHAAVASVEHHPRAQGAEPEAVFTVSPRVEGARVLLVEDLVQAAELTAPWTDLLRAGGAGWVGVLAICAETACA
jgi:predicted amidophosphoribosyltransferase